MNQLNSPGINKSLRYYLYITIIPLCAAIIAVYAQALFTTSLILTIIILGALQYSRKRGLNRFFKIILLGISLRVLICILLDTFSESGIAYSSAFGDSSFYYLTTFNALTILEGSFSIKNSVNLLKGTYGYNVLSWVYAVYYYLSGYSALALGIFNSMVGVLLAWMIHELTLKVGRNKTAATIALTLTMFWPSLLLWSISLLKDLALSLVCAVLIYLFILAIEKKQYLLIPLILVACLPMDHLRTQMDKLLIAVFLLSSILFIPKNRSTGIKITIFSLFAVLLVLNTRIPEIFDKMVYRITVSQMGFYTTGGAVYTFIPLNQGELTFFQFIPSFFKALFYYLTVPSPFSGVTLNKLPALGQMLVWYFLIIFFLPVGVGYLIKYRYRISGIVLVFTFFVFTAMALFTGNEGTAFRQRDVVTPFFFIPIAIGIVNIVAQLQSAGNTKDG